MSEWTSAPLGDFVTFQRGLDITQKAQIRGSVPVVSSGGISSHHNEAAASGPGVVIGRKGTLGKAFYLEGEYWPHDTTLWVRDFHGNHPKFVYYFMSKLDVSWLDAGSANPTLNRNHLHPLLVTWPPPNEQQAIAEVLGALDDKIVANTAVTSAAEALAANRLQRVPSLVPLSELADIDKTAVNPASLGNEVVDHFSLPAFDRDQTAVTEAASAIKSNKFQISEPVVLLSKLNPRFPRVWRAGASRGRRALASTEFLVLVPRGISSELLWTSLAQPAFASALDAKVAGTSGSHQRVKPDDALKTPVLDPRTLEEPEARAVSAALMLASALRRENQTLAATRDALLPQLMSGKLRVRDAEAAASVAGV